MIKITYLIQLESGLRVGTGLGLQGYLNATIHRTKLGQVYVPGSTVKGKVRATLHRLASGLGIETHEPTEDRAGCLLDRVPCVVCRLFGATQVPGTLHFRNAHLDEQLQQLLWQLDNQMEEQGRSAKASLEYGSEQRTNVSLDRRRRTALSGRLFSGEVVSPHVIFFGQIDGHLPQSDNPYQDVAMLVAALGMISHLGSGRGRGLGTCRFVVDRVSIKDKVVKRQELSRVLEGLVRP